jgi:hypothetical protein
MAEMSEGVVAAILPYGYWNAKEGDYRFKKNVDWTSKTNLTQRKAVSGAFALTAA